jgi:hypothetical protein
MTGVRRSPGSSRLTFKTERRKETRKARLRNKHPAEGSGGVGSPPVGLGHLSLLAPERKGIAARPAAALCVLAGVSRRRVLSEVSKIMKPDNSGQISEFEEQLRHYNDLLPRLSENEGRFPGFHTSICEVGNRKPTDGRGQFTDFTDFTPSRMGVYVASARARARPRTRRHTPLPFGKCEIREIRETARRRGVKIGLLRPPGVKSVKSPPVSDSEVTE